MKKLSKFHRLFFFFVLLFSNMIFAQLEDEIEPPPSAPIDDNLVLFAICGVLLGAYFLFNYKLTKK